MADILYLLNVIICEIIILILLFISKTRNVFNFNNETNKLFIFLLYSTILFCAIDFFWGLFNSSLISSNICLFVISILFHLLASFMPCPWINFSLKYINAKTKDKKIFYALEVLIFIVTIIALVINVKNHFLFSIENGKYVVQNSMSIITISQYSIYYLIAILCFIKYILEKNNKTRKVYLSLIIFVSPIIVLSLFQLFVLATPIYSVVYTLSICTIYTFSLLKVVENNQTQKPLIDDANEKYHELLDTLLPDYQDIFVADMLEDLVITIKSTSQIVKNSLDKKERYTLECLEKDIVEKIIYRNDKELMLKQFSLDNIRKNLVDNNCYSITYLNKDDKYVEMKVSKFSSDENKVVICFVNKDNEIRNNLQNKKNIQQAKQNKIIASLSDDYDCVFYLNVLNMEIETYKHTSNLYSKILDIVDNSTPKNITINFIDKLVVSDNKNQLKATFNEETIKNDLKNYGHQTYLFLIKNDLKNEYFNLKITRDYETKNSLIIGFINVDRTIRNQAEEKSANNILNLAENIESIFDVNLLTLEYKHFAYKRLDNGSFSNTTKTGKNFFEEIIYSKYKEVYLEDLDFFASSLSESNIRKILKKDHELSIDYRIVIDDKPVWRDLRIVEGDNDHALVGIFNSNERKILEKSQQEQLEKSKIEAEDANKAKTMFLFNMSHDIRTPMNAIVGYTEMAKKHLDDKEKMLRYLNNIGVSSRHLLNLINDCLDMSRIESGNVLIENKPLNLFTIIDNVMLMCGELAKSNNIELNKYVDNIEHNNILADELHLNEIIINVVSNAIKYSYRDNKVLFKVYESFYDDIKKIVKIQFIIEDNGVGMSESFQEKIFDTFSREYSTTISGVEGSGIGMSIVKRLVDLMKGEISIKSKTGDNHGTTVFISIPFIIAQPTSYDVNNANNFDRNKIKGVRVLLAEDNFMNREIARDILEENGLIVEEATNGMEAVSMVEKSAPGYYSLILMDIQMPIMDGYDATREIRNLENEVLRNIPIIAMTANAFIDDKNNETEVGMNGHLAKPIDHNELFKILNKIVK